MVDVQVISECAFTRIHLLTVILESQHHQMEITAGRMNLYVLASFSFQ